MDEIGADDTLPADNLGQIRPGTLLDGRYHVGAELGSGGFASVYEAAQVHLGRKCALKVLRMSMEGEDRNPTFEKRFMREARVMSELVHTNLVTVFDFGFAGELRQPFLAMELLNGHDLEREIALHGRLDARRALRLFVGALDGLQQAHNNEIVHKDLKPANLFIAHDEAGERMVVLDFGIARDLAEGATQYTMTGSFTGTPNYAAPEYVKGEAVTAALDVFQAGLVLAEALTGVRIVDEPTDMACLMSIGATDFTLPLALRESPVGPIIETALAMDPSHRYPNAGAFARALRRVDGDALEASLVHLDPNERVRLDGERGATVADEAMASTLGPDERVEAVSKTVAMTPIGAPARGTSSRTLSWVVLAVLLVVLGVGLVLALR